MESKRYYSERYSLLTRHFLKGCLSEGGNVFISPLSIFLLLSIAADSTTETTRKEILKVLGDSSGRNEAGLMLSRFRKELASRDHAFSSADAVCVKQDFADRINPGYREMITAVYGGRVFSFSRMHEAVNAWVEKKTNGMIREAVSENMNSMLLCLMNATAFEEAWGVPYEDEDIKEDCFYNEDGTASRVKMMYGCEDEYLENKDFIGFVKEYSYGSEFAFAALLPKQEGSETLLHAVDRIDFSDLLKSGKWADVHTVMPEFSFEYAKELKPLCRMLGMKEVFTEDADFFPLSPDPLMLESLQHRAFIEVNRNGTRAGAVSIAAVAAGCLPPEDTKEVILNRPFVFAIVHAESGLPVFAGVVNHLENGKADSEKRGNLLQNREGNTEQTGGYETRISTCCGF